MYKLLKKIFIIFVSSLFLFFYQTVIAQSNYQMSIANGEKINSTTYEFDVFIRSTDILFKLSSYQCALTFNPYFSNGGSLTFRYISGTSELTNPPSIAYLSVADGVQKLTFASMPGIDDIKSKAKRVGRFRLQNTNSYGNEKPYLIWNFSGNVTTILTGISFMNITDPSNHISDAIEPSKLSVIQATASSSAGSSSGPETTIDGRGYDDGSVYSRWVAGSMPQWITFDLGFVKQVNMTKFSFYYFQNGRFYRYSVLLSSDLTNWNEVVTNALSGPDEWTMNVFTPTMARYVRLKFISTSDGNSWASLWEAEVWGYSSPIPVELVSFNGEVLNDRVELKWSTASETNNRGFEVHRSREGVDEQIGFVEGKGSSSEINNYSFTDESELQPGIYSYGIKQLDYDGSYEYSDEVILEIKEQIKDYALEQNYPNPFNPVTKIRFNLPEESEVELSIYNSIGERIASLINESLSTGSHEIEFNAGEIASGIYFYRLKTRAYTQIKKMIVVK